MRPGVARPAGKLAGRTGFTLLELLLAMTLTGVLGVAAVRLFVAQHQAFVRQGEGIRRTQNARAGFDLMTREMRNAGYDPRGTAGAYFLFRVRRS